VTESTSGPDEPVVATERQHRRRASHLYGLVVSGSVLAAAPTDRGLVRVAVLLGITLLVYWSAESYAHLIAARMVHERDLSAAERREVLSDGFPLVAACLAPVVVLVVEAVLRVGTVVGVTIALAVNVLLLVLVGWRMASAGHLTGVRRVAATVSTGLLGVVMIALKHGLH